MRTLIPVALALFAARTAEAQVTGDFRGWTADGRAVIELMAGWAVCKAQPVETASQVGPASCDDCADAKACGLTALAGKPQASSPDGALRAAAGKARCGKDDGVCELEVGFLAGDERKARFVEKTPPTGERLQMSFKGAHFRPDSKAVVIHIGHSMPDAKVYEDHFFIVNLAAARAAGCDEKAMSGRFNVDLDGNGKDDLVSFEPAADATRPFMVAASVGGKQVYCRSAPLPGCEKGGGLVEILGTIDGGKRHAVRVERGCPRAAKSYVLLHDKGRVREVFSYDAWDAKDVRRSIVLADVDGDGTREIIVENPRDQAGAPESYPPRVVRYDPASGTFKNDTILTQKYNQPQTVPTPSIATPR